MDDPTTKAIEVLEALIAAAKEEAQLTIVNNTAGPIPEAYRRNPAKEEAWVPVGERLPNRRDAFEVTTRNGSVTSAWFSVEYQVWQGADVIAWREHSAPYTEPQTGGKDGN